MQANSVRIYSTSSNQRSVACDGSVGEGAATQYEGPVLCVDHTHTHTSI